MRNEFDLARAQVRKATLESMTRAVVLAHRVEIGRVCGISEPAKIGPYRTDERLLVKPQFSEKQ